ncbi:MAG: hypothetical protein IKO47_03345 [Ruminococcus sp.]|nr:hypothetical protein [Ruminococcus sp.]
MKIRRDRLSAAFGIPEPLKKDDFLAEYSEKLNTPVKPRPIIRTIRYASAGICAAAVILLFANILRTSPPDKDFAASNVITEGTHTSESAAAHTDDKEGTLTSPTESASFTTPEESTSAPATTEASSESTASTTTAVTTAEVSSQTSASTVKQTENTTSAVTTTVAATTAKITQTAQLTTTQTISTMSSAVQPVITLPSGRDRTVVPDIIILPNDKETGGSDTKPPAGVQRTELTDDELRGGQAVGAAVIRKYYTMVNGMPYIQADVYIYAAYNDGSIEVGDTISVYFSGGYVKNEDDIIKAYTEFEPEIEDQYVLFLNNSGSGFPADTFTLRNPTNISVFIYTGHSYESPLAPNRWISPRKLESLH